MLTDDAYERYMRLREDFNPYPLIRLTDSQFTMLQTIVRDPMSDEHKLIAELFRYIEELDAKQFITIGYQRMKNNG